jgi:hypothetical protein
MIRLKQGGFTMKLMKLKLWGPSLAWASSKVLGEALEMLPQGQVFL